MRFVRLVDEGASLSAAALEAGFGSYVRCHRAVWQAVGCSPKNYFQGARSFVESAIELDPLASNHPL
jgi:AraC-like DNA-binding protein